MQHSSEVTDSAGAEPFDLRGYLRPIWRRKWLVLLFVALVTGGTYAYYSNEPDEYTASTRLFIQTSELDQVLSGSSPELTDRSALNQTILLESDPVARAAAKRIGYRGDPADLLSRYKAEPEEGSDFVTVFADGPTGRQAADLANAVAEGFIAIRGAAARRRTERALETAQRQLERLPNIPENEGERSELQSTVRQLAAVLSLPAGNAEQIDPASAPTSPSAPRPVRNSLFALVIALFLGIVGAYGLERIDRRIRRIEDIEPIYRHPLLSVLPHVSKVAQDQNGKATLSSEFTEAFRFLRTNLELAHIDRPLRKIAIVSAVPGEGKSTVVRNLALAYREAGKAVAVIEADLRQPTLAKIFPIEPKPGLSEALAGDSSVEDVLQSVNVELTGLKTVARLKTSGNGKSDGEEPDLGSLAVITSGALPPNPPVLLGAERTQVMLEEISANHDVVLIDTPPLLAVSDAVPLLPAVDATVIVSRIGHSTRDGARRLMTLLSRVPESHVSGVVVNDARASAAGTAYGYYGYGYGPAE